MLCDDFCPAITGLLSQFELRDFRRYWMRDVDNCACVILVWLTQDTVAVRAVSVVNCDSPVRFWRWLCGSVVTRIASWGGVAGGVFVAASIVDIGVFSLVFV